jgi:hypothetical protein
MARGGLNAQQHNISGLRVREDGVADERVCVEETADERQQSSDEQSLVPCSYPCHLHRIQGSVARLNRRATRTPCARSPTHEPTRQLTASRLLHRAGGVVRANGGVWRLCLVVIDTQARVTVGAEENSAKDMGKFVAELDRLREATRACILTVHHEPRNGEGLRGSIALEGAATTIIHAKKDGAAVELTSSKQKDAPEQPPMRLELQPVGMSVVLALLASGISGFTTSSERHVLTVLRNLSGLAARRRPS